MVAENRGPTLLIVAVVCYVLAFTGTALRAYVRHTVVGHMGLDDWLIVASLVIYTMYISFVLVGVHYGTGRHHADLPERDVLTAIRYWYFCEWAYVLNMTVLKLGIGFFYLRIMIERWQKLVVKFVMVVCLLFGVVYFACVVAQCVPIPHIWNRYAESFESQGGCLPDGIVLGGTYLHSIISAGSDWILALLPIAMLWNVKLSPGIKAVVIVLLGIGALASTATLVRISKIHTIAEMFDFLWVTFEVAIWSTVEPGVALFACGIAALRPLLRHVFPSRFPKLHLRSSVTDFTAGNINDTGDDEIQSPEFETTVKSATESGMVETVVSRGSREITIGIFCQKPAVRASLPVSDWSEWSHLSGNSRDVTVMLDQDAPPLPPINIMEVPRSGTVTNNDQHDRSVMGKINGKKGFKSEARFKRRITAHNGGGGPVDTQRDSIIPS